MKTVTWSHSSLKDYEGCPRRYHETKVLKNYPFRDTDATIYGKELHTAAELYIKDDTPLPPQFSFLQETLDALKAKPGRKLCEHQMGVTKDLKPCGFMDKDVWVRGIADIRYVAERYTYPGVIDAKAEFIITVTWPDLNPNDVDTWVQDPGGNLVWFRAREAGMMHLDRDDRGVSNDTIVINGQKVVNPLNQEVVTIRGFVPGEYTVNLHYYETQNGQPVEANVSVVKVNPRAEVVFYGAVALQRKGDESTAVRFTLDGEGGVSGVNTLAKQLVERL